VLTLTTREACDYTGFTKGQIDQAFARFGFGENLLTSSSMPRDWTRGMLHLFKTIAELRKNGLEWNSIQNAFVKDVFMFDNFLTADRTGYDKVVSEAREMKTRVFLVVFPGGLGPDGMNYRPFEDENGGHRATIVFAEQLIDWFADAQARATSCVVVDVERIVSSLDVFLVARDAARPPRDEYDRIADVVEKHTPRGR
jgi:hypothetical protein